MCRAVLIEGLLPCVAAQIAGHLSLEERRDVEIIPPQSPPLSPSWGQRGEPERRQVEEAGGLGQSGPLLGQTLLPLPMAPLPMDLPPPHV